MTSNEAINFLDHHIQNPSDGLPDDVFYFISRTTPLVNVDLLIQDERNRTLLAWRDDEYAGTGWHVPGGIVRFKETFEARIRKVAETEIGATVSYDLMPLAVNQLIHHHHQDRGHFVSILYKCFLAETFYPENSGLDQSDAGYIMWHDTCPNDLIVYHEIYRPYIESENVKRNNYFGS